MGDIILELAGVRAAGWYLRRETIAGDGRFKKLILTDKALKMQTDITSRITCYMHSVFYGIAEEDLQVFETVILKMTENTR